MAKVLSETTGNRQAKVIPPLESLADAAASAITGGLAAGEPPGVLPARSGH